LRNSGCRGFKDLLSYCLSREIEECIGILAGDSIINKHSLSEADELRIIQKTGSGVNTIDLMECSNKGIYVCNLPGVNAIDIAEYVVGAMKAALRGFFRMDRAAWDEKSNLIGERL